MTKEQEALAQPEQEPCGWQFYTEGKWHNGMEGNAHKANTEAAGVPTRNVYPGPVVPPEQTAQPEEQLCCDKQEPVAWFRYEDGMRIYYETKAWDDLQALYTAPPQPKPQTRELQRLLFAVGQAVENGDAPFDIEDAYEDYEKAEAAHNIGDSK